MLAYESKMFMLEKIQSDLEALIAQRAQITEAGWSLQHCWLTQSKPGGTARTDHKYWQVRSRQPIFNGKTVKHLKADEVEDYKAAIERGRQLQQIDRQIKKLQQRLAQLTPTEDEFSEATAPQPHSLQPAEAQSQMLFSDLAEQEQVVKAVLARSYAIRKSLQQASAMNRLIRNRRFNPEVNRFTQTDE